MDTSINDLLLNLEDISLYLPEPDDPPCLNIEDVETLTNDYMLDVLN